jgi:hypothetical protein
LKYDTIVRLAEKTGRIDEEQFKLLFPPPHPLPKPWFELVTPLLVSASGWLAPRLDAALALFSAWLASPVGFGTAALCALVALATKWARVW